MSDAIDHLREAAAAGNARRRQMRMVVVALLLLMTVNLASVLGVGVMFLHDRDRQARERRNLAVGSKIVNDLYGVANDTNAAVHRIEGSPVPVAPQPPVAALPLPRRTTTATTKATTKATRAAMPSSTTTTTEHRSPPASGAPGPTQPPTTTTTTTRSCPTLPVVTTGVCP